MRLEFTAQDGLNVLVAADVLPGNEGFRSEAAMDGIIGVLQFAVDGLSQQQQAIANNLANADTPGFIAQNVDFQSSLSNAIDSANGGTATVAVTPSTTTPGPNGNNVDMSSQLAQAEQTTLQYQTMVDMLNAQFRLVEGAAGGSFD